MFEIEDRDGGRELMSSAGMPAAARCGLPQVITAGGSHAELGETIGAAFQSEIKDGLAEHAALQSVFLPFHRTSEGQARFAELLRLNQQAYPRFMAELRGIAGGAEVPFDELFVINFRGEYRGYLLDVEDPGCSTAALATAERRLFAHNEDGVPAYRDKMYFVRAAPTGRPEFVSLCYPGYLAGNAFGFNSNGICFSINNLRPLDVGIGLGRHFIARSLFEAESIEDALERVVVAGRAAGFHYTIGSTREQRMVCVETAPSGSKTTEVSGLYFHANHYVELPDQSQKLMDSTLRRQERAAELCAAEPPSEELVMKLLTDAAHPDFPIFRSAGGKDGCVTLCTAAFDLQARELEVFFGQPADGRSLKFDLF